LRTDIVTRTSVADAFDPLEVMLACVRWYPKVVARDLRLLAGNVGRDRQLGGITSSDGRFRGNESIGLAVRARPTAAVGSAKLLAAKQTQSTLAFKRQ